MAQIWFGAENDDVELPDRACDAHQLLDRRRIAKLVKAATMLTSTLDGAEVVRESVCFRPTTPVGAPYIGKLGEGVYVAAGAGPWGISHAPATGLVLAEMILGRPTSVPIEQLGFKHV